MMKYLNIKILFLAIFTSTILLSCEEDDDMVTPVEELNIPSNISIEDNGFFPEDVVFANNSIFVSGYGDGTIKSIDLSQETAIAQEFVAAEHDYYSRWGLASDGTVLLNLLNNPNFQDITMNGPSKLVEYNLATGAKTNEWALPENTIGNSVQIVDGKYYVCDWNPTARIIQIDPATDNIDATWYTNTTDWVPSSGGLGGVIYNNEGGFYIAQGGKFWFLPVTDGTPGTLEEVSISGISSIDADGITWAGNNTFYYAENDATDPSGNFGKVYKVELSDPTTATGSILRDGLNDSSGVWFFSNNDKDYLIILESQIGVFFGNNIVLPFNIEIIEL
ncbi:hypothetical protein Q4534_22040 [Cyclobacterium sp. 1_MG-2023]|uniref:hypothetical protein n=1 Tax=Cyclobacterium sp. 1_MG-2023 TaxID=3062681 RepID=UPI0026E38545|nr:hypothetical protein [Cyclobacterium sp. 1_MG-2023]MDO6440124.1 hypothetical protein [Cyclobacterium sp. 1_MG-2023]